MKQIAEIKVKTPSLNDVITANRSNRFTGAKQKKEIEESISWSIVASNLRPIHKPVIIHFTWVEKNAKRDLDNICGGGRKFILDALVDAGILANDNQKWVRGFTDTFIVSDKYKVLIELEEINE